MLENERHRFTQFPRTRTAHEGHERRPRGVRQAVVEMVGRCDVREKLIT